MPVAKGASPVRLGAGMTALGSLVAATGCAVKAVVRPTVIPAKVVVLDVDELEDEELVEVVSGVGLLGTLTVG